MATEAPTNGTYAQHNPYAASEQSFGSHQANTSSTTGYSSATTQPAATSSPSKEEVAWYFVEQYYTTMSRSPEKLYLFFNKRSQLVAGVEDEKSSVCAGQKAINERIKELDFHDCKVRVNNVDSQASDANIVIQVIGEMSNKSEPHRKFVQTFILAAQTNGYFVLNDIFRYIRDEDEEAEPEQAPAGSSGFQEPAPTATEPEESSKTTISHEDVAAVDKKLEEVAHEEPAKVESPATNGTPAAEEEEAEDTPAVPVSAPEEVEAEEPEVPAVEEVAEPEKPKDPVPTPAAAPKESPKPAAAPAKPAMPKTWAQLASQNRASAAAAAAAPQPAAASQPKPTPQAAAPAPTPAASSQAAPAREPSPADSGKEGSSGGWQTAGADHSRKASRAQAQPAVGTDGRVRAYVKNVYATVDADALKTALSKFGELAYFDVSRPKNSAFVEFTTLQGFQAAVAANPHKIGTDNVYVEERRQAGQFNQRGGGAMRGSGRGNFDRTGGQSRGGFNKDAPRGGAGGFTGGRGRGGAVTPRGGRGAPQAA